MDDLEQVSLHDIYARLGRLEEGQTETNSRIGHLAAQVEALCAGLDGPSHLKERVERLESWKNRLMGMGILIVVLLAAVEALRWFLV